jgi:sugar lactone lactonase YvrE
MARRPPVRPVAWQPPARPARARSRTSATPLPPLRLIEVGGHGPEDVVVDADGMVVTGVADGRLLRVHPDTGLVENIADTGGRPLGVELLPDGRLLVCDARRGLLAVDPGGIERLTTEPMRFCNNAAVGADGTVWFTDTSRRFGIDDWRADIIEHSGTGRLLRRDPGGAVEVVLDGLEFANGVALSATGDFVLVAETGAYRIRRVWLHGDRAGTDEVFVDNLPGFPDNLSTGPDGLFWVALASPRDPRLDLLARRPAVRRLVWALPEWLTPERRTVWVQALDGSGAVVHDLQGRHPRFHMVTGVRDCAGRLYLGSLTGNAIGILEGR